MIILFIIAISLVDPITSINVEKNESHPEIEPSYDKNRIHTILVKIMEDIKNETDPYNEFQQLLSCYEIRETIITLAGNETLSAIDCLFSQRITPVKIFVLNRHIKNNLEVNQNINISLLSYNVNDIINNPPDSISYLYNIPEINLSSEKIDQLYQDWYNYFYNNESLKEILLNSDLDCLLIFIIVMMIWGCCYSSLAICFPDIFQIILCYSEALIFGFSCSALLAQIFVIEDMANWILETIPFLHIYLNSEALKAVISSLVCLVSLGVFVFLFESSMLIQIIASGAGFLAPPLILFVMCLASL
jgi:hypothetical protein